MIEEWLDQILSEQDRKEKEKALETNLILTTTVRSSSEEREASTSKAHRYRNIVGDLVEKSPRRGHRAGSATLRQGRRTRNPT